MVGAFRTWVGLEWFFELCYGLVCFERVFFAGIGVRTSIDCCCRLRQRVSHQLSVTFFASPKKVTKERSLFANRSAGKKRARRCLRRVLFSSIGLVLEVSWRVLIGSSNVVGLRTLIVGCLAPTKALSWVGLEWFFELVCGLRSVS